MLEHLQNIPARVYLFGSHATGEANRFSDIDVAIEPLAELPPGALLDIAEALEDSTIPYFADVVVPSNTSPKFRERAPRRRLVARLSERITRSREAVARFREALEQPNACTITRDAAISALRRFTKPCGRRRVPP